MKSSAGSEPSTRGRTLPAAIGRDRATGPPAGGIRRAAKGRIRAATGVPAPCCLASMPSVLKRKTDRFAPGRCWPAPPACSRLLVAIVARRRGRLGAAPRRSCSARPRKRRRRPVPGKIVNGVEVIPCRVEGHVTGFQVDRPTGSPSPTRRPSTARSSPGRSPSPSPSTQGNQDDQRRGRLLQRIPRQHRRRRGSASCARSKKPTRRNTRSSARARCRSSTPTSARRRSSPSTTR